MSVAADERGGGGGGHGNGNDNGNGGDEAKAAVNSFWSRTERGVPISGRGDAEEEEEEESKLLEDGGKDTEWSVNSGSGGVYGEREGGGGDGSGDHYDDREMDESLYDFTEAASSVDVAAAPVRKGDGDFHRRFSGGGIMPGGGNGEVVDGDVRSSGGWVGEICFEQRVHILIFAKIILP